MMLIMMMVETDKLFPAEEFRNIRKENTTWLFKCME